MDVCIITTLMRRILKHYQSTIALVGGATLWDMPEEWRISVCKVLTEQEFYTIERPNSSQAVHKGDRKGLRPLSRSGSDLKLSQPA